MKQVILDTSFILSCTKQKIDFFDYLKSEGYQILIPKQVLTELEKISLPDMKKASDQEAAALSLRIIMNNIFDKIDLNTALSPLKRKSVDELIIDYANKNPSIILATLDREMQRKVKNKKLIIRGKNQLEVI